MLISEARALKLTRKHFNLVAEIIGQINCQESREDLMCQYVSLFDKSYRAFDSIQFMKMVKDVHLDCWADDGPCHEDFLAGSNL